MKAVRYKTVTAAIGLLAALFAQTSVYAQGNPPAPAGTGLPLTITFTVTATMPGTNSPTSGDKNATTKTTYSASKLKITTSTIIQQIGTGSGNTFSPAAELVYDSGDVEVIDSTNIVDASPYLTINLDPDAAGVWTGTDSSNDNTGADEQKFTGTYLVTIQYNDGNGNAYNLSGMARETYSDGTDSNGDPTKASDLLFLTFSGDGSVAAGASVVITGTMKASGSGIPE
jgi:hypothetical protein